MNDDYNSHYKHVVFKHSNRIYSCFFYNVLKFSINSKCNSRGPIGQ